MQVLGETLYHMRLLAQMGRAVDADLVKAFDDGEIDNASWVSMITSCRSCAEPHRCQTWLATHETAEYPPNGCNNAQRLVQLREVMKKDTAE